METEHLRQVARYMDGDLEVARRFALVCRAARTTDVARVVLLARRPQHLLPIDDDWPAALRRHILDQRELDKWLGQQYIGNDIESSGGLVAAISGLPSFARVRRRADGLVMYSLVGHPRAEFRPTAAARDPAILVADRMLGLEQLCRALPTVAIGECDGSYTRGWRAVHDRRDILAALEETVWAQGARYLLGRLRSRVDAWLDRTTDARLLCASNVWRAPPSYWDGRHDREVDLLESFRAHQAIDAALQAIHWATPYGRSGKSSLMLAAVERYRVSCFWIKY